MITVTIPVFNEHDNLRQLFDELVNELKALGRDWEVIFINDGSTDGSEALLDELADQEPRVRVLHFRRNHGQTAAMMAGFDYARGDIIIPMDGDLQNDPRDIRRLLAAIDAGHDVASGWRVKRKDNLLSRRLVSVLANRFVSYIAKVKLHDYGCTLKAYKRDIIKDVRLYGEMHRFIPIYASWHGASICEIPVNHRARQHGVSNYGLERTFKVLLDLIVVAFLDRFMGKPIHLFGGLGFLSFLVSFIAFLVSVYYKLWGGKSFIETPLPMLAGMTFMTGVMFVLMGLVAELVIRTYFESQQKTTYSL